MNLIKKTTRLAFGLFLFSHLTACDASNVSCNGLIDQIQYGDSIAHAGTTYYLYFNTTGWNDKIVSYYVYDSKPVFNECNRTDKEVFHSYAFEEYYYDESQKVEYDDVNKKLYVKEFVLRPNYGTQQQAVKVTYTKDKTQGFESVYDVKFTGVEE